MDINSNTLRSLFVGVKTAFNAGLTATESHWNKVAMKITSASSGEDYAWLNDMPGIREWVGDRLVHSLSASKYTLPNKLFELTVEVLRTKIEDDTYGLYSPIFQKMGADTARHPDEMLFGLLANGITERCYDGQFFFDTDHVGYDTGGNEISASNYVAGANPAWYLFDCSQPLKPLIYQERMPFDFQALTDPKDENVFMRDKFVYGVRGRSNAGFGLWQLAYRSGEVLDANTFAAARAAMMTLRKSNGKPLGIMPTHLVVPPSLDAKARQLINAELINGGESNIWAKSVQLITTPYL